MDAIAFFARLRVNWAVISWHDQRVGAIQELFIRVRYLPVWFRAINCNGVAEGQSTLGCFAHHPCKRDLSQQIVGIAATNISVRAHKPALFDFLYRSMACVCANDVANGPERGAELLSVLVDCHSVKAMPNGSPQSCMVKGERRSYLCGGFRMIWVGTPKAPTVSQTPTIFMAVSLEYLRTHFSSNVMSSSPPRNL